MNSCAKFFILAVFVLLFTVSCISSVFKHSHIEKHLFDIGVQRVRTKDPSPGALVLAVRRVQISSRYEGRELVYRTGLSSYASDYYNLFLVPPAQMLTQDLRQWLDRSGLFAKVLGVGSLMHPDLILEANTSILCGDYSERPGKAVVEMQFVLLDEGLHNITMLFSRDYRCEVIVVGSEPKDLVAALRQAVSNIYADLETDIAKFLLEIHN